MAVITITDFFNKIGSWVNGTSVFQAGTNFVVILIICFITCLLISPRKLRNISILMFPVMVGMNSIGFKVPVLFLALGAIIFIMETMSLQAIGSGIEAIAQKTTEFAGNVNESIGITKGGMRRKLFNEAKRKKEWKETVGGEIPKTRGIFLRSSGNIAKKSDRWLQNRKENRYLKEIEDFRESNKKLIPERVNMPTKMSRQLDRQNQRKRIWKERNKVWGLDE